MSVRSYKRKGEKADAHRKKVRESRQTSVKAKAAYEAKVSGSPGGTFVGKELYHKDQAERVHKKAVKKATKFNTKGKKLDKKVCYTIRSFRDLLKERMSSMGF